MKIKILADFQICMSVPLNALNNMTKIWKNWNSLRSQSFLWWKFYWMLYFHFMWQTKRKLAWPKFFCYKYLMLPKNQLFCIKKLNFWKAFGRAVTLDASFFRFKRSHMFFKIGVLKIFSKSTEKYYCWRLSLNKVAGLQGRTFLRRRFWHRCFPVNFVKFWRRPML